MNPITCLRERPDLLDRAAAWFAERWDVPAEAYRASMTACAEHPCDVPQWYAVLDDDGAIVAGCGIIENDFHERLYERCGWEFLCMATDDEGAPIRLYGAGCPKG